MKLDITLLRKSLAGMSEVPDYRRILRDSVQMQVDESASGDKQSSPLINKAHPMTVV